MHGFLKTYIPIVFILSACILSACTNASDKLPNGQPYLENYTMSECSGNCKDPEKYYYKKYTDNTLELKCGVWLNCIDKEPKVKLSTDTLFVDFNVNDSIVAACDCYYTINFTVKNLEVNPTTIMFENHEIGRYKLQAIK